MTGMGKSQGFAARPATAESWVKAGEGLRPRPRDVVGFTARLTVDITPELRGRIKIAAFQRGETVADMLRELLAREFTRVDGGAP